MPNRPRPIDTRRYLEAARKAQGPAGVLWPAKLGAVYLVKDEAIDFPASTSRTDHAFRHVIVVQSWRHCTNTPPQTMLVAPCSSSHRGSVGDWDFEIPAGEAGFTADRVVAYLSLIQPVLKSSIHEHLGQLSPTAFLEFRKRLLGLMGIIGSDTGIGPVVAP